MVRQVAFLSIILRCCVASGVASEEDSMLQSRPKEARQSQLTPVCFNTSLKYKPFIPDTESVQTSVADCRRSCQDFPSCQFFNFFPGQNKCQLSGPDAELRPDRIHGILSGPRSCCSWENFQMLPFILGTRTTQPSQEACKNRCSKVRGCSYFSFWPDGGCHLANISASAQAAKPVGGVSVKSGAATCPTVTTPEITPRPPCEVFEPQPCPDGTSEQFIDENGCQNFQCTRNCEVTGKKCSKFMKRLGANTGQPSAAACKQHCKKIPDCRFFTYFQRKGKCRLATANGCKERKNAAKRVVSSPVTCPAPMF